MSRYIVFPDVEERQLGRVKVAVHQRDDGSVPLVEIMVKENVNAQYYTYSWVSGITEISHLADLFMEVRDYLNENKKEQNVGKSPVHAGEHSGSN